MSFPDINNILITGGTGAFGQALVARLLKEPGWERICIYSRDEHKQEEMKKKFGYNEESKLRFFIGDVRDRYRLTLAMRRITHVVHAAALKIVPTSEYNPFEFVKTNISGTQNVIDCIINSYSTLTPVKALLLSTDKAVNPVNLYGATKLCAEKLFKAANNIHGPGGAMFSIVRYGNVTNSTSSVIPLFLEQIKKGEKLTLTHPDMTRFWITLDKTVDFALSRFNIMKGGEVYIPVMRSYRVRDLANILHYHTHGNRDNAYKIIGIRPGEKIHESIEEGVTSDRFLMIEDELEEKLIDIGVIDAKPV